MSLGQFHFGLGTLSIPNTGVTVLETQGRHCMLAFLKSLQANISTASVQGRQGHIEENLLKGHKEYKGTRPSVLGRKTERSGTVWPGEKISWLGFNECI